MSRSRRAILALGCVGFLSACAGFLSACASAPERARDTAAGAHASHWSGRIGVTVEGEPAEQFAASFDLSGGPHTGELRLTSPLGSTLAILQWEPGLALLRQQNAVTPYGSLDALTRAVLGVPVPISALFSWLHGVAAEAPGWTVDLSAQARGRISAQRLQPLPEARLRIVLDRDTS